IGRPELDGQLAGRDRVHVDRYADLRRGHRAERRPAAGDHPRRHRLLGAAHQRANPRRARRHHGPVHGGRRARSGHRAAGRRLARIALTIGMAVGTNILIFERIREELRVGKTPRASIEAGFRRALRTIVDTHLTVMGTAIILLSFGTSSVKGFGVSLFIGLGASLFTAYFFTRLLFDLLYMGRRKVDAISI